MPTFKYLGDVIGKSGGCVDATSARITAAWKSFRQLLPIITNHGILLKNQCNIFSSCMRKSLLSDCETWPASSKIIRCLTLADNGMVCWICGVRVEQRIRTQDLHEKLDIISVTEEIGWHRIKYFGHLQRMNKNLWPRRVNDYVVPRILSRGHPQLCWSDVITKDLKDLNIRKELADKRVGWRRAIMPGKIKLQRVRPIRGGQEL